VGSQDELPLVARNVLGEAGVTTPWSASEGVSEGDVTAEALAYLGVGWWEEREEEEEAEEREWEAVEAHGFSCVRDQGERLSMYEKVLVSWGWTGFLRRQCGEYNLSLVLHGRES